MSFTALFIFVLSSAAIVKTFQVVDAWPFPFLRSFKLFYCPFCLGFHVGYLNYLFMAFFAPYLMMPFDYGLIPLMGFVSSIGSYIICSVFKDDGIQLDCNCTRRRDRRFP